MLGQSGGLTRNDSAPPSGVLGMDDISFATWPYLVIAGSIYTGWKLHSGHAVVETVHGSYDAAVARCRELGFLTEPWTMPHVDPIIYDWRGPDRHRTWSYFFNP